MNELKNKLMAELKDYSHRELTRDSLCTIDTLAHALKNILKIEYMMGETKDYEKEGSEVIEELETVLEKLKSM